jgi:hypothetical protein
MIARVIVFCIPTDYIFIITKTYRYVKAKNKNIYFKNKKITTKVVLCTWFDRLTTPQDIPSPSTLLRMVRRMVSVIEPQVSEANTSRDYTLYAIKVAGFRLQVAGFRLQVAPHFCSGYLDEGSRGECRGTGSGL